MSRPPDPLANPSPPSAWGGTAAELCLIHFQEEDLGTARCPVCRHPLIARQGRAGPYFHCGCPPRTAQPTAAVSIKKESPAAALVPQGA